jgi:hypothetical protein
MRKTILFFAITAFFSTKSIGQSLVAKVNYNQMKFETGLVFDELSFVINSADRSSLDSNQLVQKIKIDNKIKNCIILVDDMKPKAVVMMELDIESEIELQQMFRNLFKNLNLNQLILNDRVFVSSENIQL